MKEFLKSIFSKDDTNVYTLMLLSIISVISSLIFYKLDGDISSNLLTLNITLIGGLIGDKFTEKFRK